MLTHSYPFIKITVESGDHFLKETIVYRFTGAYRRYIIRVEHYEYDVYVLKFFPWQYKNEEKLRYQILTKDGDARKIFNTCLNLAESILAINENASFGFKGQNGPDEPESNTKRFKVYALYAFKYFEPKAFEHYIDENVSIYLLLNTKNKEESLSTKINCALNEYYKSGVEMNLTRDR